MERLRGEPFVADALEGPFKSAQRWIEECSRQVTLPINFCGSILIIRLYRLIAPAHEQTECWMTAVYDAAAAYDLAFLALAHADDEADLTTARDGKLTRFVTHPNSRAVDGANLLLSGITGMHERLQRWPASTIAPNDSLLQQHPLAMETMGALIRALREASFPILLDRSGLGHVTEGKPTPSGLGALIVDDLSLGRVRAYVRHRAHTYFLRACELAALLARHTGFSAPLSETLDDLFGHLATLGAAADDLQDLLSDFAAGIHSLCTVVAHLCVAGEPALRPAFRRSVPDVVIRDQRKRLDGFLGAGPGNLDSTALLTLLREIEFQRALSDYLAEEGAKFAAAVHKAAVEFNFSPRLVVELVSVIAADAAFEVPASYYEALDADPDSIMIQMLLSQAGQFISSYVVGRFWPTEDG